MINDHAKQRPFAMKREANEAGKQKNGQRCPKCAKLSSGEPAMPVKDIFPLSLVTPDFSRKFLTGVARSTRNWYMQNRMSAKSYRI